MNLLLTMIMSFKAILFTSSKNVIVSLEQLSPLWMSGSPWIHAWYMQTFEKNYDYFIVFSKQSYGLIIAIIYLYRGFMTEPVYAPVKLQKKFSDTNLIICASNDSTENNSVMLNCSSRLSACLIIQNI